MKVKVKEVVTYGGHSLSANGSVNFTLKAKYSELVNTIQLMQLLNNDIEIKAKIPAEKAKRLGYFRIKSIGIDGDGESNIKFVGLHDSVEMDNLNSLPMNDSDIKEFVVMMSSDVEIEETEEGDEDEE